MGKVKSIEEIGMNEFNKLKEVGKPILVKVPCKTIDYICEVENDGGFRIGAEVKPTDYPVSMFFDGYDESKFSQKIREKILTERNLSISNSYNDSLMYGRVLDKIPESAEELRRILCEFITDVSCAVKEVDRMVREHRRSLPRQIFRTLKAYHHLVTSLEQRSSSTYSK